MHAVCVLTYIVLKYRFGQQQQQYVPSQKWIYVIYFFGFLKKNIFLCFRLFCVTWFFDSDSDHTYDKTASVEEQSSRMEWFWKTKFDTFHVVPNCWMSPISKLKLVCCLLTCRRTSEIFYCYPNIRK